MKLDNEMTTTMDECVIKRKATAIQHERHNSTDHPCRCRSLRLGPNERERELGESIVTLQRLTEGHSVVGLSPSDSVTTIPALADHITQLALELNMTDIPAHPVVVWLIEVV